MTWEARGSHGGFANPQGLLGYTTFNSGQGKEMEMSLVLFMEGYKVWIKCITIKEQCFKLEKKEVTWFLSYPFYSPHRIYLTWSKQTVGMASLLQKATENIFAYSIFAYIQADSEILNIRHNFSSFKS